MNKYSFIGAGKMASAIVKGMIANNIGAEQISCICGDDDSGKILSEATGINLLAQEDFFADDLDILVLACKPQQLESIGDTSSLEAEVLISILAGTSISKLRQKFPKVKNIVRSMPNMPAQIAMGISCYSAESDLSEGEKAKVENIFSAIGEFILVDEAKLDAVTALSGSGPGYIFEIADAFIEAGMNIGFSFEEAKKLTYQTFIGSAHLLEQSELSASELRNAVSSPGGTTLAGLKALSDYNLREAVKSCLEAAKNRSQELAKL
ncbi:MAG: pyrroline-5-carboxylate reductase [Opitutales bacterium]